METNPVAKTEVKTVTLETIVVYPALLQTLKPHESPSAAEIVKILV